MEWVYEGKFIDRSPKIRAAGAPIKFTGKLVDCLHDYPVDDAVETVLAEAGLHKIPLEMPAARMRNTRHVGIYTGVHGTLRRPVETRYQTLLRDLRETAWPSYWTKELGRSADSTGGMPQHIANDKDHVFGCKSRREYTCRELVNPPDVTSYEIVFNEAENHDMYQRTHGNFYPGEQYHRNYGPPFDKTIRYGSAPKRHATATCSMKWGNNSPTEMANSIFADFQQQRKPQLGKPMAPNHNIDCVPPGHRFGISSQREFRTLGDLITPDREPSLFRKDVLRWLCILYDVRSLCRRRHVNFRELLGACIYVDKEQRAWMQLDTFKRILRDANIMVLLDDVLPFAALFGIYDEARGEVHYCGMLDLLDVDVELPPLDMLKEKPDCTQFITSPQYDLLNTPGKDMTRCPPAGLYAATAKQTDLKNLGCETTVGILVNPNIFTNYGLSHIDLLSPRSPDYMRKLFERLGYQFPDDVFEKLWAIGKEWEKKENVSVDTFRKIMEQAAPITIKEHIEDETVCHKVPQCVT